MLSRPRQPPASLLVGHLPPRGRTSRDRKADHVEQRVARSRAPVAVREIPVFFHPVHFCYATYIRQLCSLCHSDCLSPDIAQYEPRFVTAHIGELECLVINKDKDAFLGC